MESTDSVARAPSKSPSSSAKGDADGTRLPCVPCVPRIGSAQHRASCEALDFLREMKRGLLRPGAVVHGVAIGACIKSQRLEEGDGFSLFGSGFFQSRDGAQALCFIAASLRLTTSPAATWRIHARLWHSGTPLACHLAPGSLVAALAAAGRWAEAVQLASQTQLQLGVTFAALQLCDFRVRTATALVAGLSAAETLGDWQEGWPGGRKSEIERSHMSQRQPWRC